MIKGFLSLMSVVVIFTSQGVAVTSSGIVVANPKVEGKEEASHDDLWLHGLNVIRDDKAITSMCNGYVHNVNHALRDFKEKLNKLTVKELSPLEGKLEAQRLIKNEDDLKKLQELRTQIDFLGKNIEAYMNLKESIEHLCRVKQRLLSTPSPSEQDNREYWLAVMTYKDTRKTAQDTWGIELETVGFVAREEPKTQRTYGSSTGVAGHVDTVPKLADQMVSMVGPRWKLETKQAEGELKGRKPATSGEGPIYRADVDHKGQEKASGVTVKVGTDREQGHDIYNP